MSQLTNVSPSMSSSSSQIPSEILRTSGVGASFEEGTTPNLPTITEFDKMGLSSQLMRGIYKFGEFGIDKPAPIQECGIPAFMTGKDLIVRSAPATGKTFMCAIGALIPKEINQSIQNTDLTTLIITPAPARTEEILGVISELDVKTTQPIKVICHPFPTDEIPLSKVKLLILADIDEFSADSQDDLNILLAALGDDAQIAIVCSAMTENVTSIANKFLKDPIKIFLNPVNLTLTMKSPHNLPKGMSQPANISPEASFRMNVSVRQPYNADFDGNEPKSLCDEYNIKLFLSDKEDMEILETWKQLDEIMISTEVKKQFFGMNVGNYVPLIKKKNKSK
jgi:hypothetical protein